ncbi:uncharacterized protein LOC127878613 [Dreissena polymorpha]|uniref:Uncharacterized protein n=1 Tax=Dreissena polymorpha TaxID=45954 RepID=A0A9D4KF82_DREPO|nr:uncharacterized protein LOC127878613 [Dreissena polymorpha]KAH3838790.1 hypothetical protein DPMN_112205 [Dreissena polymorpha]
MKIYKHSVGYTVHIENNAVIERNAPKKFLKILFLVVVISEVFVAPSAGNTVFKKTHATSLASPWRQNKTSRSVIECTRFCIGISWCTTLSYRTSLKECLLYDLDHIAMHLIDDITSDVYSYNKSDISASNSESNAHPGWTLAFRGTPGIGDDVFQAWVNGTNVTTTDTECMALTPNTCAHHYRNPIVDSWELLDVQQVMFEMYSEIHGTKNLIFDAQGSTITSWFSESRITNSSWNATKQRPFYGWFSMQGSNPFTFLVCGRLFPCGCDELYTMVVNNKESCADISGKPHPQFYFATEDVYGVIWVDGFFKNERMASADLIAIFIKHNALENRP